MLQSGPQVLLEPAHHQVVVPRRLGKKTLQRPRRRRNRLRQVLGVAPLLGLHQQALQIVATVLPRLPASKGWRKVVMKILKGLVHPLKVCRIHRPAPPPEAFANSPIILSYQPSL